MDSFDISMMTNQKNQKQQELAHFKMKLAAATITTKLVMSSRDTSGMAGTRYQEQHDTTKTTIESFFHLAERERADTLRAIETELNTLTYDISSLETQYQSALASEKSEREAAINQ